MLSREQADVFAKVMAWYKTDSKRYVIGGYAGAGKTTLARYIAQEIGEDAALFCAYTGKAANVLREKGCKNAGTIHGSLYAPLKRPDDKGRPRFGYNPKPEWMNASVIFVDEYSMLPRKIIEDIERDGKKIIYLGDPFQLPPIQGECPLKPDYFIEEIHRQALESAIIRFSKSVRECELIPFGSHGDLSYIRQAETDPDMYTDADQLIVGYNSTRTAFNKRFRTLRGYDRPLPMKGDKIICLKNNHEAGLFNGMIGEAWNTCVQSGISYRLDFDDHTDLPVWHGDCIGEGAKYRHDDDRMKGLERFDYAYAITAHKSQGSEFDNLLVFNQPIGSEQVDRRRWLYTAITRAKKKCILVEPGK